MSRHLLFTGIFLYVVAGCFGQDFKRVKEINTGPNGSSYPFNFTIANNKLFFIAFDNVNYQNLWVTEGDSSTTRMLGPLGGALSSVSNLVAFKNKVFFSYNDNINGQELWVSDGTAAGTVLFKDIYPGTSGSFPQAFTVANNRLFFTAGNADGEKRLFVTDGTPTGTVVIKNYFVDVFNGMTNFAVLNNEIYFRGDDGTGSGYGLWKSNGLAGGTSLLATGMIPGTSGCNYVVLNNKLYFSGFDYVHGSEIWVSDGTATGTHIVKNLGADRGGILLGGAPPAMYVYNSKIYFASKDSALGTELFVSDGTEPGTHIVKDIYPGPEGSQPFEMTVSSGFLYMICSLTQELWQSDGTAAGTKLVKGISPYSKFSGVWNQKMYITNTTYDNVIWESDGTAAGTGPAKVQNTNNMIYSMGTDPNFTEYNGELYFSGYSPGITLAYEPCKLSLGASAIKAFSFTGNGNWSNPANWSGNKVPPATLPSGYSIVINGNCILDIAQHIQAGASLTVATGSSLVILGSLNIL